MAYTRPDGDAANFEFSGDVYTRPTGGAANFSFEPPAPAGSQISVWLGSAWALKPLKRWDGSAWVPAILKRWVGVSWVDI